MTYKQIEASREVRLWLGQVIVPAIVGVAIAMSNPEIRAKAANKLEAVKNKFNIKKEG